MKKTLKTKVMAGTITVALLSSAGFALANTDAGGALKTWYEGVFNQSSAQIQTDVDAYKDSKVPALQEEFEGMKADATGQINFARNYQINTKTTAINNAKSQHLNSLDSAKREILDEAGLKFNQVFVEGNAAIEALGAEAKNYASGQLTSHTSSIGNAALEKVNADLTIVEQNAVSELEAAVLAAQEEINQEVTTQQGWVTAELKKRIDFKIGDLRRELNAILTKLVAAQEQAIEREAGTIEARAKSALDEVITGINQ